MPPCQNSGNNAVPRWVNSSDLLGRRQPELSADLDKGETEAAPQPRFNWASRTWDIMRCPRSTGEAGNIGRWGKAATDETGRWPPLIYSINRKMTSPLGGMHLRHPVFAPMNQIAPLPSRTFQPSRRDRLTNNSNTVWWVLSQEQMLVRTKAQR